MIRTGDFNLMNITGVDRGFYVLELDGREVLLPRKEAGTHCVVGGSANVFVYSNSPGDLRATFTRPHALVDETAFLYVRETLEFGAFLDWGIDKDLFVPRRCQPKPLERGDSCIVRVCQDPDGEGLIGDCHFRNYLKTGPGDFSPGDEVRLLVYERTPLGYNAVVNNDYTGLLYHDGIRSALETGQKKTGYIKNLREDGGIDLTLQPEGLDGVLSAADCILAALRAKDGFLPLHDKSDPGEIERVLGLSKKAFKRGAGILYKQRVISISTDGLRLV